VYAGLAHVYDSIERGEYRLMPGLICDYNMFNFRK